MGNDRRIAVAEKGFFTGLHGGMGVAAKGMVLAFVVFTALNVDFANSIYSAVRGWIEASLAWYYIAAVTFMLLACLYLMCSRYGSIRLGDDDSRPEFSNFSWFAMLFSAGVGIGLLFFSIAEPLFYFDNTQPWKYPNNPFADAAGATQLTEQRALHAMRVTYFHWGFHGWAVYVIIGLCLAYFGFRKKLPFTLRSALYPVIGDRIYGPVGHGVDLLAVFGTVFGVATLARTRGQPDGCRSQRALRHRSRACDADSPDRRHHHRRDLLGCVRRRQRDPHHLRVEHLAQHRAGRVLSVRRTVPVADGILRDVARRLHLERDSMGFWTAGEAGDKAWQGGWTIFYWGWWISWAPFVGMFIARISRGRTIREFMVGVMFVPTTIAFFWLCIFGGNALYMELNAAGGAGTAGVLDMVRNWNLPSALFGTIERVTDISWLNWAMAALATILLATWFITSSDSGTLVITTMLSMGDDNPPQKFRIIWGTGEGFVAAVLLLAGGLKALQTAAIAAALPVSIIMLAMTYGLLKSLREDPGALPDPEEELAPDGTRLGGDLRA